MVISFADEVRRMTDDVAGHVRAHATQKDDVRYDA